MLLIDRPDQRISSTDEWVEYLNEMQDLEDRVDDLEDLNQVREEIELAERVLEDRGWDRDGVHR